MTAESHAAQVARTLARLEEHLGGEVVALLADPTLISLSANPDGSLWAERQDGNERVGTITRHHVELFICAVANCKGLGSPKKPMLSAKLPDDLPWRAARIQVVLPPIVSAPSFTIERLATETDAS